MSALAPCVTASADMDITLQEFFSHYGGQEIESCTQSSRRVIFLELQKSSCKKAALRGFSLNCGVSGAGWRLSVVPWKCLLPRNVSLLQRVNLGWLCCGRGVSWQRTRQWEESSLMEEKYSPFRMLKQSYSVSIPIWSHCRV